MCVDLPCGYSSQTLAKVVAYADIFLSICTLGILTLLWTIVSASAINPVEIIPVNNETSESNWGKTFGDFIFSQRSQSHYSQEYKCLLKTNLIEGVSFPQLMISIGIFYVVGTFTLGIILLNGAQRRNHETLWRWLVISIFLWFVRILLIIVWIISGPPGVDRVGPIYIGFFNCFYNGLVISVINNFIRQIKEEGVILYSKSSKNHKHKFRIY